MRVQIMKAFDKDRQPNGLKINATKGGLLNGSKPSAKLRPPNISYW